MEAASSYFVSRQITGQSQSFGLGTEPRCARGVLSTPPDRPPPSFSRTESFFKEWAEAGLLKVVDCWDF